MQVIVVKNPEAGLERAKEEIYKIVDNKTVLFLSGGNTPKPLYETLVKEGIVKPAAAALIDERFGEKMHETSNEKMIAETGLLKYFTALNIPFYPILTQRHSGLDPESQQDKKIPETSSGQALNSSKGLPLTRDAVQDDELSKEVAERYDETVRKLFFHFPKSVGIMGIGADGHTAGLPPINSKFKTQNAKIYGGHEFVTSYNSPETYFKERVTLTFAGLGLLDFFIVLVFGKDKAKALKKTFEQGSLEEIPARFYLSDENAKKTLFITDQRVE